MNVGLRSYAFFKARLLGLVALSGITGAIMHYGLAIALTIAVFIVREHLSVSYSQGPLLILFMFPIICSALIGGLGPGLFATALAGLGTLYFNIPPTGSFLVSSAADLVHWSMLIVNGILVSLLSRALLRAKTGELEQWRRRAASQESLRLNEALFKVVFERAALGIAVVSLDGHWLKVNRRICEMLGYTSDELLQLTFQDITYPEDLQADLDQVRRLLNGDIDNYSMEKRYRCKNNQLMWGELNVALVHKIDGSPDYFISTITDIQARKESEIALTETRRLAGVGAWLWDVKSNVHIWSPEIYRLYGLDPEAPPITYPEVRRYFTGDSWSRLSEAINKALGAGSPYQCDADVVRADGSHCTITARGEAIQDMNGVIIGLRATMQDITERKRAEDQLHQIQEQALTEQRQARLNTLTLMEDANNARTRAEATIVALRESQQRLMLAEESAHIGIWDWNIAGNQCYWSPECHRLYGMEPGELKTQDQWRSRVYPEDLALIDAQWQTRILLHKPFEVEFRMRLPSGEMRWITSKGSARYDPEGNPVRLIGINIDISKRKQTEEQLSKLAQAVEQSGESVIITNLNAEIEYVNAALLGNTGYSLDEVIGRNPRLLKSGKTPLANFKDMWANLRDGRSWKGEFVNKRKNGSEYVEFAIITPIRGHDGRITHYVSVQEDITERKQLGEELNRYRDHLEDMVERRTAELAEARAIADAANQAKSEFLANMSHEIRTPMNAIIGLSYLLRRSELTSAQSDRLDKINAAAQHLLSIINDILDLSKIEAGCIELEQTDFSLVSLLDQIRSLIGEQAHNKGLTIDLRHEQMPSSLRGDSTRLRQALLNYASNAVKFTDHGGITLSAGIIEEDENGLLVRFQVEDSGVGIAAEKPNRP